MHVLGLLGSPRAKGNSEYMMALFMKEMEKKRYETQVLKVPRMKINHCIGCGTCDKKGACIFTDDDFTTVFLPALEKADILVASAPVYFYGFPSALKTLIDRIQVVWSRKYLLKKNDYKGRDRKGVLLGVAATKGKDLFDGLKLTGRYFFDAADIKYAGEVLIRGVDEKGEMEKHPSVQQQIVDLASQL